MSPGDSRFMAVMSVLALVCGVWLIGSIGVTWYDILYVVVGTLGFVLSVAD